MFVPYWHGRASSGSIDQEVWHDVAVPENRKRPTSVREENRRRTAERIVTATADLVRSSGHADFSMPEVAEASGVALRTVYRYFPKRQDLVDALATVADQAVGSLPRSVEEIGSWLAEAWQNLLADELLLRAQHLGAAGAAIRKSRADQHRALTEGLVLAVAPEIAPQELDDIVDVGMLVSSSTALFEYIDVLGVSAERGARLAGKTIATLISAAMLVEVENDRGRKG